MPKILLLTTSDRGGGAAIVTMRLAESLRQAGAEVRVIVGDKNRFFLIRKALDRAMVWAMNGFSMRNLWLTDGGFCGQDITRCEDFDWADVVHLHWVNQGFLSLQIIDKILHSGKRVCWTLHDMWPVTSICHHAGKCDRYTELCHDCPQLLHPSARDLSYTTFQRKANIYTDVTRFSFIGCSSWISGTAKRSALTQHLPITTIPNAIDLGRFTLGDKEEAKRRLGIPLDAKVVCFGAARIDLPLKGLHFLIEAMKQVSGKTMLLLMGGVKDRSILQHITVPYTYLGFVSDAASVYHACDCLVNCSTFENLGTTMIEAQACGCTPAAFLTGGTGDIIQEGVTGYLAEPQNIDSLAKAIHNALTRPIKAEALRTFVEKHFSPKAVTNRHLCLYESLEEK